MRKPPLKSGPAPTRGFVSPVWLALLLAAVTILSYLPAWHGGFIWDDESHVVHNRLLVEPDGLKRIWFSLEAPQYYPLVFTTFRLERALWGLHPEGYHFVNLLLHSASALLLWQLLRRLRVPGAWLAAAVFALHPVNVESVAWITERKNTLSLFFFLSSLLLYLRSDEPSNHTQHATRHTFHVSRFTLHPLHPPPSSLFYGLSLLAFALALFSKTAVAPLPVVLLLLAWWRRRRVASRDVWRAVPFLLAALALIPLTVVFEHQAGAQIVRSDPFWARLAGAGWAVWFYLYKALLPFNLSFVYPRWRINPAHLLSYVPGLLVLLGFAVCWRYRRGWGRAGLFGLGYFLVMLLPALGFVNIYFMRYSLVSDHWQYFAIIGPISLAVAGLSRALGFWGERRPWLRPVVGGALLLALAALTWRQSANYSNMETLWRTTIAQNPACWMAYNNLGLAVLEKGRADEAMAHFRKALEIDPGFVDAHNNLGTAFDKKGQLDEAVSQYQEAIRLQPDFAAPYNNLGNALVRKGQTDEAIRQFRKAIRLQPAAAEAHNNLGILLDKKGQTDEAIREFQQALRLQPEYAEAHNNFGIALGKQSQTDEAIRQFQEALRLQPEYAEARFNLGTALDKKGRTDEAISQYQEALRLNPDHADAHYNFGIALIRKGQLDEAISQLREAIRLQPDSFQPHLALAQILPRLGRLKDAAFHMEEFLRTCPRANLEAPNSPFRGPALGALNNLAWFLATRPRAEERDGALAVRFAERACELTQYRQMILVGVLAAAYAEAGRFLEAVTTAERSSTLATQAGDQAVLAKNRRLLELYRAGRPYHEAAPRVQSPPAAPQP